MTSNAEGREPSGTAIGRFSGCAPRMGIGQFGAGTGRCNGKKNEPTETDLPQRSVPSPQPQEPGEGGRELGRRRRNATELRAHICRGPDTRSSRPKSPSTSSAPSMTRVLTPALLRLRHRRRRRRRRSVALRRRWPPVGRRVDRSKRRFEATAAAALQRRNRCNRRSTIEPSVGSAKTQASRG
jgi:hypothetical protein